MRFVYSLIVLFAFLSTPAFAQNNMPMPPCDGNITVVRVSEIKPGGTLEGLQASITAQVAWYRANGITDNQIVISRVILRDKTTGAHSYSDSEVIIYHLRPPSADRTPNHGDAGWNAFIKLYNDNAVLKNEYVTCLPKLMQ